MKNEIPNLEKVTWKQILTLFNVLQECLSYKIETVKRRFESESYNFQDTLNLLLLLNLVKIKDDQIGITQGLKKQLIQDKESIKQYFIEKLLENRGIFGELLDNYLYNFEPYNNSYRFIPFIKDRLQYSGIRNFLIDLSLLKYETSSEGYLTEEELSAHIEKRQISYKMFTCQIEEDKALGYEAELLIIKYEKNRLKDNLDLINKIYHVSLKNVKAGYDIKSYKQLKKNLYEPKYIEVKAVSMNSQTFYWTRNEINTASRLGGKYYLYLLPVCNRGTFDITKLKIIQNPYSNVYLNHKEWLQEVEVTLFYKK